MSLANLAVSLPPYAEDLKINIARLATDTVLTDQQKWGCFLACAFSIGQKQVIETIEDEAVVRLNDAAREGAKAAATIMAMNTVYYGAVNLLDNHDYRADPPGLSMIALSNPGVDKIDFELWAFAVSAITNCRPCLNSHEAELHKRGVPIERVQAALRIASVVNAVSVVLRAEEVNS